ncbi:hypothetical protein RRG08_021661 [Elysia crispata]|uniref:Uncharacterized protein n=1 Tax=Elysia crispata TaxID=231223 RepID=A0AAE1CJ41_9GAST|nr:hypothetical protein RRG08_021661 [Elysia crispata]
MLIYFNHNCRFILEQQTRNQMRDPHAVHVTESQPAVSISRPFTSALLHSRQEQITVDKPFIMMICLAGRKENRLASKMSCHAQLFVSGMKYNVTSIGVV